MPSSQFNQIPQICNAIKTIKPVKTLDVGCGYGKYGFLTREICEVWLGIKNLKVDAIEGYEKYVTTLQKVVYDRIYIGNALDELRKMKKNQYDLILAIDIVEHFYPIDGKTFIQLCNKVGRNVIISTPKKVKKQGEVFGNQLEEHKSQWTPELITMGNEGILIENDDNWIVVMGEITNDANKNTSKTTRKV